jgi:hypothetical protein
MIHFIYPVSERTRPWSRLNTLAVKLAVKHYPDKKIIVWTNEMDRVPDIQGITIRQATMPIEHQYPQYVSDLFRLKLLYEQGGMYLDTDMLLLKPVPTYLDLMLSWETKDKSSICNAIISAKAGNKFIKEWLDAMPAALESSTWAYGGVVLPKELLIGKDITVYDHTFACPLDLSKPWMFDPELKAQAREMVKNSYAIHCFETYWAPYFNELSDNSFLAEIYREFE